MKLGGVTKLDKRNTKPEKKLTMMYCRQIMMSSSFFQLIGATRNPDSGCMVYNSYFLLIATFYLTKTENKTKISLT